MSKPTCKVCGKTIAYDNKSGLCRSCYNEQCNKEKIEKCAICGIGRIWNGKSINFVLDHIDGDASNNSEENLRLICPNCDSQLDTYKSKNKNSARTHRKNYE